MPSIINATTSNGLVTSADNSGVLQLATNSGTTAVTIDTSQNVGVGTASPARRLDVTSSGSTTCQIERTDGTYVLALKGSGTTSTGALGMATNDMVMLTNGSERMRITSVGSVLINGTDTSYSPYIQATGNADNFNIAVVKNTGTNYSTGVRLVTFVNSSNAIAGVISHSGVTSVTYGTSSDERLKENIVDAPNALDKVMNIKIRSYDWKEDSSHVEYGLVAQELNSVYGEPVGVGGDDVAQNAWSIEYGRLTPILLKALQELNAKVDAQAAEIQALKGVA